MLIRWTVLCAAVAALTACSAMSPAAKDAAPADAKAQAATTWSYPSEHNQFRELGWE